MLVLKFEGKMMENARGNDERAHPPTLLKWIPLQTF